MLSSEKRLTEARSKLERSRQTRRQPRAFLLLGTAALIATPATFAEDILESEEVPWAAFGSTNPSLWISPDREPTSENYVAIQTASLDSEDGSYARVSASLSDTEPLFRLGTPPPPVKAKKPSEMEAFNASFEKKITLELNADFDDIPLGPIIVESTLSRILAVDAVQLQNALSPLVDESTALLLSQFDSGLVSVERLQAIGVEAKLDPSTLTLDIDAPRRAADPVDLSLRPQEAPQGTVTARPASLAAGLTSAFLVSQNFDEDGNAVVASALSGFVNVGGVRGLNLDFGGNLVIDDGTGDSRFDADRTVLFMDRPEHALRFEAGTLLTPLTGLAGEGDYLGLGITKSYRALQPTRILRPLGQRSFILDRASEVSVLVDGQVISRFDAPAGEVNLNDIPLANVSNRVSIVVEDDFGRQEIQSFSIASDAFLLEPGLSEYSVGIGHARDRSRSGFAYSDDLIAAANYQVGLSSNLTVGGFGFASEDLLVAGGETVFGALNGIARLELSYSESDTNDGGAAAAFDYRWASPPSAGPAQNFAIALDYREQSFTAAGSPFGSSIKFDASAFYERQLTDTFRVNVSGSYSEDYVSDSASENVTLGATYQFGKLQLGAGARFGSIAGRDEEIGAFFTLTRRLGRRSSVNARYDTQSDRSSVRYRRPSRNEVGSLGFESELLTRDQNLTLRGAADYTGNRFRSRLGVSQNSDESNLDGDTVLSARLQTGIAFADGKFGLGRDPGRGFVMVDRHKSLAGADVEIRSRGRAGLRARSSALGPAISALSAPYVPVTTDVDVANAPIGYNVGEGSYYSIPGARSGIKITVGSDAYRSIVASFTAGGEPLSLVAGKLTNLGTGESQVTFTNSSGRALLSNLKPGKYRLDFTGTGYQFEFAIDAGSDTYSDLGVIELVAGDPK